MTTTREAKWKDGFGKMPPPPARRRPTPPETAEPAAVEPEPATPARPLAVVPPQTEPAAAAAPSAPVAPQAPAATPAQSTDPAATRPRVAPSQSQHPSTAIEQAAVPAAALHVADLPAPDRVTAPPEPATADPRPLPRPAPAGATPTGRRVTAAEVRSARQAAKHAKAVVDGLADGGVGVQAVEAELAADRLHLVLDSFGAPENVLDHADLIADALTVSDVECSLEGDRVHVWAVLGTAGSSRQVAAWVPVAVRSAVREVRDKTGETVTTIVLSAFNRQAGADGSGLVALFPDTAITAPGPMSIATRKVRPGIETPVQLWLYLHPSQEATLDQAVARTGAGSRSALLTRILEADLGLAPSTNG